MVVESPMHGGCRKLESVGEVKQRDIFAHIRLRAPKPTAESTFKLTIPLPILRNLLIRQAYHRAANPAVITSYPPAKSI